MALFSWVVRSYRAWAKRQLDQALQAPVIPSQAERFLSTHRFF
jgi:hypothetical protein